MNELITYEDLKLTENNIFRLKILLPTFGILLYLFSLIFKFAKYPLTPFLYISLFYLLFIILTHYLFNKIKEEKVIFFLLSISLIEIIIATFVIYYTGGITSYFFVSYFLIIFNISAFRFPNYPYLISAISYVSYLILILGQYYKIIPYVNCLTSEVYNINYSIFYQRGFFVGLFLLIFSLYANKVIKDLNNERKILKLLREGSLLLTSYIGDRENFLKSIAKIAKEIVLADSSSIIEYRDGKYKFVAWENFDDNVIKHIEEKMNLTKPVNLENIREKKSVMKVDDVYKLSYWIKIENVRSYIGSPIIYKDEVIAILNVDSKKPNNFSESDVINIEILSKIVSTITEKDHLFNEINELNRRLEDISVKDYLTSLFNRRKLEEILKYQINIFLRKKINFQLIMIDIDNFKMINDNLGHLEGDQLLIKVGKILEKNIRKVDYLFRYGGDEFIIILPDFPPNDVEIVMNRINSQFKEEFNNFSKNYKINLSYGYLSFEDFYIDITNKNPENSYDDDFLFFNVLKYVDNLLYISKKLKHID